MAEPFQLSKWFNGGLGRGEATHSAHTTDSEDGDVSTAAAGVPAAEEEREPAGGGALECFVCRIPNPEYMSTTHVKQAPSVPVCSVECETEYLERKGMRPKGDRSYEMLDGPPECYVCARANPDFMSTNKVKGAPSVAVCGVDCEARYLMMCKKKAQAASADAAPSTPPPRGSSAGSRSKRAKRDEGEANAFSDPKRLRRSLNFLEDHLLGNDETNSYKSWWLGALTFYDFVYQRHGMWHSYSIDNNVPRVDQCLVKYATWNIYRELDRSTAYIRKHVMRWQQAHQGRLSLREVLWMTVVFRYCNKLETFDKLKGIPSSDAFAPFKKRMLSFAKRADDQKFLAGDRDLTIARYVDTLEEFLSKLDDCTVAIKDCEHIEQIFETLRNFKDNALGSFTCWQIVCDLMGLRMLNEEILTDEFVWLTLDARKSLVQIFGKNRARPSEYVALARLLQQRQLQGFKALQVDFPFFMNQKLDLKNIAHALHGFQVFRNIKLIEHKMVHKQEPGTTHPVPYSSRTYLMDSEACEICAEAENEDQLVLCDLCSRMFHKYCINMKELPPASWVCSACKEMQNYPEQGVVAEQEVISIE